MRWAAAMAIACALSCSAVAAALPQKGSLTSAQRRALTFGGRDWTYLIQPAAGSGLHPIVVMLHGGTQSDSQVWTQTSLPTLATREGFILVAPNAGEHRHWNDGRGATLGGEGASTADDLGFLRAVIAEVIARDHCDPSAVFMIGASNGGFMTMHFACRSGALLRAAGNVISDLPAAEARTCAPGKALPWISVNGDSDPLIPFAGDPGGEVKNGQVQPPLLSADQTFQFFADKAGCAPAIRSERLPHVDAASASTAERRTRASCAGGASSVQYVLHKAGHNWPGLPLRPLAARILGGANQDVDAGEIIWAHFKATLARK